MTKTKQCSHCHKRLVANRFSSNARCKSGLASWCKKCASSYADKKRRMNPDPKYRLWLSTYCSAKRRRLEHTICPSDIPTPVFCPLIGIRLDYRRTKGQGKVKHNAATVDRIDNTRGYIPGNIQVLSSRANRVKSDFTLPQLKRLAEAILRLVSSTENSI